MVQLGNRKELIIDTSKNIMDGARQVADIKITRLEIIIVMELDCAQLMVNVLERQDDHLI